MIFRAHTTYADTFRHPNLNENELQFGCRLGFDSWADTSCSGKHAFVESFVDGKTVNASGFSSSLGSMKNLPIANVLYAYDTNDGEVLILENNNTIYLGEHMDDSLINPIQSEDNNIRVDLRPRHFYPHEHSSQTIRFDDGTVIPLKYDGVLPYIPIRRPTNDEIHNCRRLALTSPDDWDPYNYKGFIASVPNTTSATTTTSDPISDSLHFASIATKIAVEPVLVPFDDTYMSLHAIKSKHQSSLTPEALSKLWNIGLPTAVRTLKATTHKCIRTTGMLSRRFKTDKAQLKYKQLSRQYGTFYADYLKVGIKSIRGFIGGTLYTNKMGFKKFFPCSNERGETTASTLRSFLDIVGLPYSLHTDGHSNFSEGPFKKLLRRFGILQTVTEPYSPWQNRAENAIGETKKYARRLMQTTNTPIRLWCFCYEFSADVLSLCATGRFDLQGRTPYECTMNYTPDISEYTAFSWYQWCWFFNEMTKEKELGRWLGPAHHVGQAFCSYILKDNAEIITRSSVLPVTDEELSNTNTKLLCTSFTTNVENKIGNHKQPLFDPHVPDKIYYQAFLDDYDNNTFDDGELPYGNEIRDAIPAEIDEPYLESLDNYIGTKVVIPGITPGTEPVLATIRKRKRDNNGNPIGQANANPILDTRIYELEFPDGRVEEYGMNVIIENILSQTDEHGYDCGIFQEIISTRSNPSIAIPKGDNAFTTINGQSKPVITTKGWDVLVKWNDQSTTWVPLSVAKESFPVQLAEHAFANNIHSEPAFNWWVKHVLRKRDRIIKQINVMRKHRKSKNMKFGVIVPQTVEEALELDKINGNTLWRDAIDKEMQNNRIAFQLLGREERPPPGYRRITCHMNFEVKMDLRRKARYVAGGHLTDPPTSMTYSTVVGRETVRIAFLIAALNNLDVLAGDIQNAYLNAPTTEKLYFIAGKEWKSDEGRPVVIIRALYGLKSSALAWRNHLANILQNDLKFTSSLADPDLWYKPSVDDQGNEYYSYILVYVDDILVISHSPRQYMSALQSSYTVREETIKSPEQYLGADIHKVHFHDGSFAFTMSSSSYIKNAIKNIKARLKDDGFRFNSKLSSVEFSAKQPFSSNDYRPELDTSAECTPEQTQFYQNIIGILRWSVELGRIDISFECSALSSFLAFPRTGHLQQALHVMKYLDIHHENELTFDPEPYDLSPSELAEAEEKSKAMAALYAHPIEEIPPNAPTPRGRAVQINCFVDSDHAGDRITRRSHTGILIYLNKAPISWFSKKQATVESSTFGSEFVALRIATEQIISLRYKLRMFGVPIDGYANTFCDNESVFKNASIAESRLKKKHNSICFHRVRESVACGIQMIFKVDSKYNLADILTKPLPSHTRIALRRMIMPSHK